MTGTVNKGFHQINEWPLFISDFITECGFRKSTRTGRLNNANKNRWGKMENTWSIDTEKSVFRSWTLLSCPHLASINRTSTAELIDIDQACAAPKVLGESQHGCRPYSSAHLSKPQWNLSRWLIVRHFDVCGCDRLLLKWLGVSLWLDKSRGREFQWNWNVHNTLLRRKYCH